MDEKNDKDRMNGRNEMIESLMKLHKCSDCPIRRQASRKLGPLFARIHRWHATWWPGWKLYLAERGVRSATPCRAPKVRRPQDI
jgi:hypothetical protein